MAIPDDALTGLVVQARVPADAANVTDAVEDAVAVWKRRINRVGVVAAIALTEDQLHLVRQHLAPRERSLGES